MNIFISWSGCRTKSVAVALREMIVKLKIGFNPWTSVQDIAVGRVWRNELFKSLKIAEIGIVCTSRNSLKSKWVQFEIGALCTSLQDDRLFPYIIDNDQNEVSETIEHLQCCHKNLDDTWKLIKCIYKIKYGSVPNINIRKKFLILWPKFSDATNNNNIKDSPYSLNNEDYNRLDNRGLENILKIHFDATAGRIHSTIRKAIDDVDGDILKLKFELLAPSIANTLREGRHLLYPFQYESIDHINDLLDKMFPDAKLEMQITKGLELAAKCQSADQFMTVVESITKEEQTKLIRELPRLISKRQPDY